MPLGQGRLISTSAHLRRRYMCSCISHVYSHVDREYLSVPLIQQVVPRNNRNFWPKQTQKPTRCQSLGSNQRQIHMAMDQESRRKKKKHDRRATAWGHLCGLWNLAKASQAIFVVRPCFSTLPWNPPLLGKTSPCTKPGLLWCTRSTFLTNPVFLRCTNTKSV